VCRWCPTSCSAARTTSAHGSHCRCAWRRPTLPSSRGRSRRLPGRLQPPVQRRDWFRCRYVETPFPITYRLNDPFGSIDEGSQKLMQTLLFSQVSTCWTSSFFWQEVRIGTDYLIHACSSHGLPSLCQPPGRRIANNIQPDMSAICSCCPGSSTF